MDPLSPNACRVLGCLLEKELTVPATYPLTTNALVSACNQSSGRDPILSLTAHDVEDAVRELRTAHLAHLIYPSHGSRTEKVRHAIADVFTLDPAERAIVTLLLLRGPQTPGELRTRSDRLHSFGALDEVDAALQALAARDEPIVVQLPRQPGHKEHRWRHLLGQSEAAPPASAGPPPAEVAPLAAFVGRWVGQGTGHYPTIDPFGYTEEIEFRPVPGKPLLAYRSATKAADDGRALHGESGFLRLIDGTFAELVLSSGPGIVEILEALIDGNELAFTSTLVAGTATAKSVTATVRHYRVEGDELTYDLAMAAVGQPLQSHLKARLQRAD